MPPSKIPGCYSCGHPKVMGQKQCAIHRREWEQNHRRTHAEIRAAVRAEQREQAEAIVPPTEAQRLFRLEKAKRDERLRQAPLLAAAKQAYDAMLDRERELKKGGRPRKPDSVTPGKPRLFLKSNPADALLEAVAPWRGVGT